MDNVKRLYEEVGLDEEDLEIFGTLDPLTVVELGAVAKNLANKILEETGAKDTLITASHKWARITFPIYLQRYRKLIDVSDITPQALELDPATAELKAELQKEQPEGDTLAAMLEILGRLNDAAYMEIFRHYVKREQPEPDPKRPVPTYREFQKTEIAQRLVFPVDKVNRNFFKIWDMVTSTPQHQVRFDVTPRSLNPNTPPSYILFALEQRGKHAETPEDYATRIMIAAQALYEENNGKSFSLQAMYEQMGNEGKLGGVNRKRITKTMESLNSYWVHIDNAEEAKNQRNRKEYKYHGSLFPFEYVEELENGQVTKTAIRLLRSVPLIDFAEDRKQITTISRRLLQTPVNHTNINIRLENYLLAEIAGIKSGRRSNKILFETLFTEIRQTSRKQKYRIKKTIPLLLDHWKNENHIKSYEIQPDGITIFYDKPEPKTTTKRRRKKTS